MPNPLVECIPNFSEARRPEIVDRIVAAIQAVPGVHLLDRHSDLDHNRTVITFVGAPQAVEKAAFDSIAEASKWIDLNQHQGEHPRIGATDVVPFVPISDITMAECVEMARRLAQKVSAELKIPTYLYEEAAARPDRQNLENIRRGQFEGLKAEIQTNPDRAPDFGPSLLGPAGATVIGARQPLIAFNAYLTTNDVAIAQKIAKAIRHSSGGLRYVKAMGVLVEGMAQVSMNLTNFRQTPIARVVEMIRREAARYGVGIRHTELVGLIPQEALTHAAQWYLQLDQFEYDQILESRVMESAQQPAAPDFIESLAAATPTPGGGSAAAHTAAAAAALAGMVARLTLGKKKYADVTPQMEAIAAAADGLRQELIAAVAEDSAAFEDILAAFRLPKDTPEQAAARDAAVEAATFHASAVPLRVAARAVQVMDLNLQAATLGNLNAISDAASGVFLGNAAFASAGLNVRINLQNVKDQAQAATMLTKLSALQRQAAAVEASLLSVLKERANLG